MDLGFPFSGIPILAADSSPGNGLSHNIVRITIITMEHGGAIVELHGIRSSRLGCSCEYHSICGMMAVRDAVFRIRLEEIREGKA